ncbi:MDR family MFS transporter [Brevibacillus dissolubilis]|uniref:MDR family MFS transporter n=1 Tax=Brevibacillus dissolubilis TaxID=1844116 RepID=UPI00111657EC|nr:MFS transporter [Brevibacillus dissolubilis]
MRFRDLHANIKIRFYEMFLGNLLGNMIYPFMAIYFAQKFGAAITGILLAVNIGVGIVAGMYGGPLADRIGRRKIILAAESLRFLALIGLVIVNSPWLEMPVVTYLMMMLINIVWGISSPANEAMIVDCTTNENRPFVYSLNYWSWNVTMLIGGIVGGFFFQSYRFEIFIGAACVSLMAIGLLLFFIKETYQPTATVQQVKTGITNPFASLASYKSVLANKIFLLYCAAATLNGAIENMGFSYIGVRLAEQFGEQQLLSWQGWQLKVDGIEMYGVLSSENALLVAVLGLMIPFLIRRFREQHTLYFGIVTYTVGYALCAVLNQPWILFVAMFLATAGELIWVPVQQTVMVRLIPGESRSTYLAFNRMANSVNQMTGPLAVTVGSFVSATGMGTIFFLSGMMAIYLFTVLFRKIAADQAQAATEGSGA